MRSFAAVSTRRPDPRPRLLLIEGIVGSGKSSTAKELSRRLHRSGREARWVREEAADHPVTSKSPDRPKVAADRIDWWLRGWSRLVERDDRADLVLEGTAFQSTVRMLYADCASRESIDDYVARFVDAVRPTEPQMVYLRRDSAEADLRDRVLPLRGRDWVERVAAYGESTIVGRERGWRGADGLVAFWSEYRDLCDELVATMAMPILTIDPSGRSWSDVHDEIEAWIR